MTGKQVLVLGGNFGGVTTALAVQHELHEYLFNVSHQLRKAGLKKRAKLTYVTPEPALGHFGIGRLPPRRTAPGHVHAQRAHRLGCRHRHRPCR